MVKSLSLTLPVDGQLIGKVQATTAADYEKVMAAATQAFKVFRAMPAPKKEEKSFANLEIN